MSSSLVDLVGCIFEKVIEDSDAVTLFFIARLFEILILLISHDDLLQLVVNLLNCRLPVVAVINLTGELANKLAHQLNDLELILSLESLAEFFDLILREHVDFKLWHLSQNFTIE